MAYSVTEWGDYLTDIVAGSPAAVLRWVWTRESAGEPSNLTVDGASEAVEELRRCIVTATR